MNIAHQIYPHLPSWARLAAVNARGYYLRRSRYDANTEKLVEEALERDHWSEKDWENWRSKRLSHILHRAVTRVPYYRDRWAERRRNGDKASWEYLENWEVLEKQDLRAMNPQFLADDCLPSKMFCDNTSGTTGTSINTWLTGETVKQWYALFEARCRRWYGISRRDRWAILGGQLVTPFRQKKPPFWVWNNGLNQLYMSAYHISPGQTNYYLDALNKYGIEYIFGYSAAVYGLAQEAVRQGRRDIELTVAITNAEPLYDYQREAIEEAFSCPVRETYGMAEIAAAASECENGRLHIWPDAGVIEIAEDSRDADRSGDLICTGLVNPDTPLIRYRVGDRGRSSNDECQCGRRLPLLAGIDGRTDDILFSPDGRACSHVHLVMGGSLPVLEAQIVQKSLDRIRVLYVPSDGFNESIIETIRERIYSRMGQVNVSFEEVLQIPRTSNGKFRAVVCDLSTEERSLIENAGVNL